jgi:hypothetical protein
MSNALSYSFSQTSHAGIHDLFARDAVAGGLFLPEKADPAAVTMRRINFRFAIFSGLE